jgi:GAF domain-containing protein
VDETAISRPIRVGGEAIGKLVAAEVPEARADLAEVLDAVAQGLSTHVENLRLTERTQQALAQTEALYSATASLTSAASLAEVLHAVADTRGATSATLLTISADAHGQPKELTISASWSATQDNALPLGTKFPIDQFPTSQIWLNDPDNAVLIADLNTDPRIDPFTRDYSRQFGVQAYVYLPLRVGGSWVGLLMVSWAAPQKFSEADAQLFRAIAAQTAVVINNRLLFEQTQKRAEREALINTITQKIQSAVTVDSALQTALRELGTALKAQRASVALKLAGGNGGAPEAVAAEG